MVKFLSLVSIVAFFSVFISSCGEDTPDTGTLKIVVKLNSDTGNPVISGKIGISDSEQKLNQGIHIYDVQTDLTGTAEMINMTPRMYYFDCLSHVSGKQYYGTGSCQVLPGEVKTYLLILN